MEKIYTWKDVEDAARKTKQIIKARNKACALIEDARARYVKEKTRARSKKAALEKDALLNSPHFAPLKEYERREDILEAYGCACITSSELDRLEELWDEREAIREKTVDGFYVDDVTNALTEAYAFASALWEDEIDECKIVKNEFGRQLELDEKERAEWNARIDAEYKKILGGNA